MVVQRTHINPLLGLPLTLYHTCFFHLSLIFSVLSMSCVCIHMHLCKYICIYLRSVYTHFFFPESFESKFLMPYCYVYFLKIRVLPCITPVGLLVLKRNINTFCCCLMNYVYLILSLYPIMSFIAFLKFNTQFYLRSDIITNCHVSLVSFF